jgi:1-acyl-sn-glycerol-3-phosphate acyltransferase
MTRARTYLEPWDGAPARVGERLATSDRRSPSHWLDLDFLRAFSESMVRPWADRYFRASVRGAENFVAARPSLLAMNHSGMGWPWDAVVFMHLIASRFGYGREWVLRGFALPYFFTIPGLAPLCLRTGLYPATFKNLDLLLNERELVLYFPEGAEGIGKGWAKRYALQPFHTSFIKLAAKYGAPITPCVCLGAEELNPFATNVEALAKLTGLPIFPVSPLQLALFPAWLTSAIFALPSRLRYHVGEPLRFRLDPSEATEDDYRKAAEELRGIMQRMIDEGRAEAEAAPPREAPRAPLLGEYHHPFSLADHALAALPFGWPVLYLRFWNAYQAARGAAPAEAQPAYDAHPLSAADQAMLLVPWLWPVPLVRHWKALFREDPHLIRATFGRR